MKADLSMLSGAQIRMARGALRWSVQELAEASGVSASTIKRMELQDGPPVSTVANLRAIEAAFTQRGLRFAGEGTASRGVFYPAQP